ncbi:MAG: DUF72 domain-containing protein [Bacteroidota bacterium]
MKFGKLESPDGVNFQLPPYQWLTSSNKGAQTKVFAGGTMWGIKQWKGSFFPEKLPQKDFGSWYCKQFGCIELNATHYRIHPRSTIEKWKNMAGTDFQFCPKWPQLISHYRRFNNSEGLTDEFLEAIMGFEELLGPCFIQLPPNFKPTKWQELHSYLTSLPRDIKVAIEFRHPEWFWDENAHVWEALADLGIGSVISDTAGRRDAVHMKITAPFVVMRFGGYNLHSSDERRLEDWIDLIAVWRELGLESFHLLIHQPDSILTPQTAKLWSDLCQKKLGITVKHPQPVSSGTLF